MKFKEIKPGMVIHCPTEEDARALLGHLSELGFGWSDENSPMTDAKYELYGDSTCYWLEDNKRIVISDLLFAKRDKKTIIEFSDLIEPEPRFKVGDKVKPKSNLMPDEYYGAQPYSEYMDKFSGRIMTVEKYSDIDEGYFLEEGEGWVWTDEMLEPAVELDLNNLGESIINAINSTQEPMTAVEILEWLQKYDGKPEMVEVFGVGYAEDVMEVSAADYIVDEITAYVAEKKKPKPVETEWDKICRIIQIDPNNRKRVVYEEILKDNTPSGEEPSYSEQTEEILKKYVSEHGGICIAVIEEVCRAKESET